MPTLNDLLGKFEKTAGQQGPAIDAAPKSGQTKVASDGGNTMKAPDSLASIYLKMSNIDFDKTASDAATSDEPEVPADTDFAAAAEKVAAAEAAEGADALAGGGDEQPSDEGEPDFLKVAQEYDAAGRIMARGFWDEFNKLASESTSAAPNQDTESPSAAKTPALGNRGLPTVETNFAGSPNHDQRMTANGGKENYKNSLVEKKKIRAGVTGDNVGAAATQLGGGAPVGFATARDLAGGKSA